MSRVLDSVPRVRGVGARAADGAHHVALRYVRRQRTATRARAAALLSHVPRSALAPDSNVTTSCDQSNFFLHL